MLNIYICLRYVLFGVFIISNAIIATFAVAVWSLAKAASLTIPIIGYLIFLGASGLAFIFTVIFVELARRNAVTSRVWFECTWVAIYFVMELAGATAYSVIVPSKMCSNQVEAVVKGSCSSTRVLMAFTWICTSILMCYLAILAISALIRAKTDSRIWLCNIHNFPSFDPGRLASAPATPTLPRFINRAPTLQMPKPRRPQPEFINSYRSGLSSEYEIEHFQPLPAAELTHLPMPAATAAHPSAHVPSAFYPQAVQSSLITPAAVQQPQVRQNVAPSPPPLGDWPRADALLQPSKSRRQPRSPEAEQPLATSPSRPRPTGPRKRSIDYRPPALDLSKISTLKER